MPAFGSGLSGQVMLAAESTVGTAVTPTIGMEFLNEKPFSLIPTFVEGQGIKPGQAVARASRSVISRFDVNGGLVVEHGDRGHYGLQWKHALGSAITTPTVVLGAAYKQIHTPGIKTGLSQTVQMGRPFTTGTVQPHTYRGLKTTDWSFSCSDGAVAQLDLTMDGWAESTATGLAAFSSTANVQNFTFKDCTVFKIGGTAATASGETTITSGAAIASIVKGITITGSTPMDTERFGMGNAGIKAEQVENGFQTFMISLDCEYTNLTEFYSKLGLGTYFPLQVDFMHFDLAGLDANGVNAGPNPYLLSFIFPSVKVKTAPPQVSGPGIVPMKVDLQAYDDGTNPVVQVKIVSTDTTL